MAFQKCVLSLMNTCFAEECSIIHSCGTIKIASCTECLFTVKRSCGYSSLMYHEVFWFPSNQPQDRNQKNWPK